MNEVYPKRMFGDSFNNYPQRLKRNSYSLNNEPPEDTLKGN